MPVPVPGQPADHPDRVSRTGLELNLPQGQMPVSVTNVPVSAAPFNQNDGFSPGSAIRLHIPQLDTQAALNRTHAVGLLNLSAYRAKNAPISSPTNIDPHQDPRSTPAAQQQISDFLEPNGTFVNVCESAPCHSYDYTP